MRLHQCLRAAFRAHDVARMRRNLQNIPAKAIAIQWPRERPAPREAGVLVPLINWRDEAAVLFTLRSSDLREHRGEVSFPGGQRDAGDATIEETALRETAEEIYVPRERVDVLGTFAPVPNKTNTTRVTPIVGFLGDVDPAQVRFNPSEVEAVFALTLRQLRDPALVSTRQFRDTAIKYNVYAGGPAEVWGLTAIILAGVLKHVVVPSSDC